jgi:hypothetical protein
MYNIKKNSGRKEGYKPNKSGYLKKKQNTTYFQHNKYNKYRSKYNYSNKFSYNSYEYEYETSIYYENNEKMKKNIQVNLKEVNQENFLYDYENKENLSIVANESEKQYEVKTNEKSNKRIDDSFNILEDDKSSTIEQDLNSSENNTIILPRTASFCNTSSQICSDDKENFDPNINNNYQNIKNYKNSNEFFNKNISSINLSSEDFKEAFYVPKRLNNLYNLYSKKSQVNIKQMTQPENNFQNYSSISLSSSLGINNILNKTNILQNNNSKNINDLNLLLNNNLFSNQNLNLNINNSHSNDSIQPFNLFDSHNSNSFLKMNSFDSFHYSLKTQMSSSFIENEKEKENTDILEIYIKISEKNNLIFKIRRYDDMFKTVKIFCEINKLDTKLIRPIIIYIIKALNSIYGIYNLNLKCDEIKLLKDIKEFFYNDDSKEKEENIKDNNNISNDDYFSSSFKNNNLHHENREGSNLSESFLNEG